MKVYQKEVPSIVLELTESEAKALAAIIGTMGEKQLDNVEDTAVEQGLVNALKEEREANPNFAYIWYSQLNDLVQ